MSDRGLNEIADDLLDIAANIADLGEFRRLDLQKRCARKLGQAAGNLGLTATGRPYHQDIFRQHLLAHRALEAQAAPAVTQSDRDRPLGIFLPDDETVEFGNNLTRRKIGHMAFPSSRGHFEAIDSSTKLVFV